MTNRSIALSGLALALALLAAACDKPAPSKPSGKPAATGAAHHDGAECAAKTCGDCTHEGGCFWSLDKKKCQSGDSGCKAGRCVNDLNDCPK